MVNSKKPLLGRFITKFISDVTPQYPSANTLSPKPQRTLSKLTQVRLGLKGQVAIFLKAAFLKDAFLELALSQEASSKNLLVAFSGGLDSTALLHLLASLRADLAFTLSAMHVHHGLSANANAWVDCCTQACSQLNIPLQVVHVTIPADNALGIEAAARHLRYDALLGSHADYVCLAHHQDDQAETLLLQLARGAGIKGLSAMAAVDHKRHLLRPLLDISRAELEAYALANGLTWIEDESNQNVAFDRNFLRHTILPKLHERYPSIAKTLSRSASHMAEATNLLGELAVIDAQVYVHDKKLNIDALHNLSTSRARNLLRWWLASLHQSMPNILMPSTEQLAQILSQLAYAKTDAQIEIVLAGHAQQITTVRRYKNEAYLITQPKQKPNDANILWQGEAELALPDNSRLIFSEKLGAGLALKRLDVGKLRVSYRQGGESFKPDANRPTRTLKHLLQETNMPPWQREWLPLIYADGKLALVPSLGVDASMQANADEIGWVVEWMQT